MKVSDLRVKIFADGADKTEMLAMYAKPVVQGLTTNPSLMKKAGVTDYEAFAKDILRTIKDKSISFEVFSDEFEDMARQARKIATWGDNVYVKIPVTNSKGASAAPLIQELARAKVKLNVTAIMTFDQVETVSEALQNHAPSYISIFAGRIADTGVDPLPLMQRSLALMKAHPKQEMIWASPRELLNIFQAHDIGCHIITVTPDILKRLALVGKDLNAYSLETVKMFYDDAVAAGFKL